MTGTPNRSRLILSVALALSLLVNALALGAGIRVYQARQAVLGDTALRLAPAMRRDLTAALGLHKADLAPALQALQTARRNAVLAATAAPYDAAKTSAALDVLRHSLNDLMTEAQSIVLTDLARQAGD